MESDCEKGTQTPATTHTIDEGLRNSGLIVSENAFYSFVIINRAVENMLFSNSEINEGVHLFAKRTHRLRNPIWAILAIAIDRAHTKTTMPCNSVERCARETNAKQCAKGRM